MKTVTIFGSSVPKEGDEEYTIARELGALLAGHGYAVCNGGFGGTMAASARGAREAGGHTRGITFNHFARHANQWIELEERAESLFGRITQLMEAGDAYVILKGGTGTLLELSAVWEFIGKGLLPERPIVIMGEYWEPLVRQLGSEAFREGRGDCTRFIKQANTPVECVAILDEMLGSK